MYKPHTSSDRRRYVEEVTMDEPIVFNVEHPDEVGILLVDAMHMRVKRLVGRDETVFQGRGPSVSVRLEVCPCTFLKRLSVMIFFSGLATVRGVARSLPKTSEAPLGQLRAPNLPRTSQNAFSALLQCADTFADYHLTN